MKIAHIGFFALILAVIGSGSNAISQTTTTQSHTTTTSTKTFVLVPDSSNSAAYQEWESWIKRENTLKPFLRNSHGESTRIGQITIIVRSSQTSELLAASTPPDSGPPSPLPVNGNAGQQITVINQTSSVYQEWIYQWVDTGAGGGSWSEVHYIGTYCGDSIKDTGHLCTATAY